MVDFYNGYVVAPRWQQLVTGYFTAEQIEEEIIHFNDFSREEFKHFLKQAAASDRIVKQGDSFKKITRKTEP